MNVSFPLLQVVQCYLGMRIRKLAGDKLTQPICVHMFLGQTTAATEDALAGRLKVGAPRFLAHMIANG